MMETFSGLTVDPLSGKCRFRIQDIAHSLSMICRYNGHCRYFYSVAQHSVLVSRYLADKWQGNLGMLPLFGLLHDASEAYLGDIISPVKEKLPGYGDAEIVLSDSIFLKFCGETPTHYEPHKIKDADHVMLMAEAYYLMPSRGEGWFSGEVISKPSSFAPESWGPQTAEEIFLYEFNQLSGDFE